MAEKRKLFKKIYDSPSETFATRDINAGLSVTHSAAPPISHSIGNWVAEVLAENKIFLKSI